MQKHLVQTPARLLLSLLLLATAMPAAAQDAPPQQREHVVRRGDTLWDLARAYLNNPFAWPLIYEANRNIVENPHWIYPQERLIIPPILRSDAPDSPSGLPLGDPIGIPLTETPLPPPVELPPEQDPTVVTTLDLRQPVVSVHEHMAAPWLSTTAEREIRGRVLRLVDPAVEQNRLPPMLHPGDRLYIGALAGPRPARGDSIMIVRLGRAIGAYGRIVDPVAVLVVEDGTESVLTARVARQFGVARVGDPIMAMRDAPEIGLGEPAPVAGGPQGELLQFVDDEVLHGPTDMAFISLGAASGVGIGDEFAVYVPARPVGGGRPETLPPETIGTVRVVRVEDRSATVRVLTASSSALRNGLPVVMVRRMP